jgi:hypothetical protein
MIRYPSERELNQLHQALVRLDVESVTFKIERASPWLLVDVWVHLEGERKIAMWRATGAIYAVKSDGAVDEEPFIRGAWVAR